jgi:hypothetical protein
MSVKRSPWRWIIFFVLLIALAATGITLPVVYNLGQQLKPEQLNASKRLWQEKGPRDYDLSFSITHDRERLAERHVVQVRDGQVIYSACEGEVVAMSPLIAAVVGLPVGGTAEGGARDVPAIFAHIEGLLRQEDTAEQRNFIVAVFDPKEGYPRRFIRRIRGTKTREEWDIRVWPAGALSRPDAPWKQKPDAPEQRN